MSIIDSLRDYLLTYAGLETGAPLWVDYLGTENTGYSINPIAGARIVESYINGGSLREFPFAFQSSVSTADDAARIGTNEFYELLADWFESQTNSGTLPIMDTGKTALSIEALTSGYLMEQGQSETGIYQITCKLTYEQQP